MVKTSDWQSFYRQFETYLLALMAAPLWDAIPEPMVEYIDPDFKWMKGNKYFNQAC